MSERRPARGRAGLARAAEPLRTVVRRHRRLLAGAMLALAAGIAVEAVAPRPPTGPAVVTAAGDLAAGTVLSAGDLEVVRTPRNLVPDGALPPGDAAGHTLAAPIRRGEVVTDARLVGPGLLAGQPEGTLAVPVRPSDPAVTALLRAGDRVRVVAGPDPGDPESFAGGTASVLVESATVLAVTGGSGGSLLGGGEPALLLVAVQARQAAEVAAAGDGRWLSVAVLP